MAAKRDDAATEKDQRAGEDRRSAEDRRTDGERRGENMGRDPERRSGEDRRQKGPEAERRKTERRINEYRLRPEVLEFINAVNDFKSVRQKPFPTWSEIYDIFVGLGYRVADGPEAELAWYNFDALNTPPTHPSRLESDTVYLDYGEAGDEVLLRTQTSPVQVRWMEEHSPPVYVVVPGKVYRKETTDATHLPVFHQIEGLAVDESIQFSDLKGTLAHFSREFFGAKTTVRLRPHFFPFTEPSAELDVSCFACDGGVPGCRVCGGAGWLEMLGCGMVDPNVLGAVGYDPSQLSGFAFGMGVERMAMVRHGINDIRHFVDNDLRFLRQF